jgi:hypothetical protein
MPRGASRWLVRGALRRAAKFCVIGNKCTRSRIYRLVESLSLNGRLNISQARRAGSDELRRGSWFLNA